MSYKVHGHDAITRWIDKPARELGKPPVRRFYATCSCGADSRKPSGVTYSSAGMASGWIGSHMDTERAIDSSVRLQPELARFHNGGAA